MNNIVSDSILEVNLDSILQNYSKLASFAPSSVCGAVVKANAYGLGVKKIAPSLYSVNCRDFFVATLQEGLELSNILSPDANIYIFHGVKNGEERYFYDNGLIPVINDIYQLDIWIKCALDVAHKLPAILHFDTGMNRLGFSYQLAEKISNYDNLKMLDIKYVMSHLVNAENQNDSINEKQLQRFWQVKKYFPRSKLSFSNSRAITSGEKFHFNLLRPGCGLYGVNGESNAGLKNVFNLKSKVIQIREIEEDGFVGYGSTASVKKGSRIAVVPVGYADGYLRSLSNNSYAKFLEYKLPLLGRVSMDLTIFDISNIPAGQIKQGDYIELIGDDYNIDKIAKNAGTIGYEILTSLGSRYNVVYKI
jgi:alanine racemase